MAEQQQFQFQLPAGPFAFSVVSSGGYSGGYADTEYEATTKALAEARRLGGGMITVGPTFPIPRRA